MTAIPDKLEKRGIQLALRLLLAALFIGAGIMHFVKPSIFISIMPNWLPLHRELVLISGGCEIAGGIGLLHPRLRRFARYGLIALLLAVFPANINMALNSDNFNFIPVYLLWLRLPLQFLLIWLVLKVK